MMHTNQSLKKALYFRLLE